MTSVLVVDDSALMRKVLKGILLDSGGFEVHTARNGFDGLAVLQQVQPDVVTLDIHMPEMDGLSCLAEIMRHHPTPVVMVSSLTGASTSATLEALALGAVDYVEKPGGTVSLNLEQVGPEIVRKVRSASRAKVRRHSDLTTRVRAEHLQARPARSARHAGRPSPTPVPHTDTEVVLVGSSTGGPALLTTLAAGLPAGLAAPIVVAQHMPAAFTAALARRLNETGPLAACEVSHPTPLRPGTIYIGHGDADVVLSRRDGELSARSVPVGAEYRWHPSVDRMVASARRVVDPGRMIGVLLTGMGDDGAEEMAGLRADGGRTIAESEETAVVWGMPGELVARGGATRVLPAEDIATQIAAWVR